MKKGRIRTIFIALLILVLPVPVYADYGSIKIDGYYDDWEDKPHTEVYNGRNPREEKINYVSLFRDEENVYVHIEYAYINNQTIDNMKVDLFTNLGDEQYKLIPDFDMTDDETNPNDLENKSPETNPSDTNSQNGEKTNGTDTTNNKDTSNTPDNSSSDDNGNGNTQDKGNNSNGNDNSNNENSSNGNNTQDGGNTSNDNGTQNNGNSSTGNDTSNNSDNGNSSNTDKPQQSDQILAGNKGVVYIADQTAEKTSDNGQDVIDKAQLDLSDEPESGSASDLNSNNSQDKKDADDANSNNGQDKKDVADPNPNPDQNSGTNPGNSTDQNAETNPNNNADQNTSTDQNKDQNTGTEQSSGAGITNPGTNGSPLDLFDPNTIKDPKDLLDCFDPDNGNDPNDQENADWNFHHPGVYGTWPFTVYQGHDPVGYGYFTRSFCEPDEAEFYIPLNTITEEPDGIKEISMTIKKLGKQAVICVGAGTEPYVGVAISSAVALLSVAGYSYKKQKPLILKKGK